MKATTHFLLGTLLVMSFVFAACETAPAEDTTVTVEEEEAMDDTMLDTDADAEVETDAEAEAMMDE